MELQLIIRASDQNVSDHVVNCTSDWTVERLKNYLAVVYPSKPIVHQQKLIYSGHLLHDHLQLKDVLRQEEANSVHIFHLVYNGVNRASTGKNDSPVQNASNQSSNSESIILPPEPSNTSENVLRYRSYASTSQLNNYQLQFQQPFPVMNNDPQIVAQMTAMQQMYAYYISQYMQSVNLASTSGNATAFPTVSNAQQNTTNVAPNDVAVQRPQNQRNNAQPIVPLEDNNELADRDWLDQFFLYFRFLILFIVVYFYSTPERLMVVIVCAVIAFLYHEGWFFRRGTVPAALLLMRGNVNNEGNPNANNPEQPVQNDNQSANEDSHDGHEIEAAMDGDDPPHAQNPDALNNNQVFSPLNFLASFFSSLIPEPPPPVNIN